MGVLVLKLLVIVFGQRHILTLLIVEEISVKKIYAVFALCHGIDIIHIMVTASLKDKI